MPKGKVRASTATIPTLFVLLCCWSRGQGGMISAGGGAVSVGGNFRSGCHGSSWCFIRGCGRGNNNIIQICLAAALPTGSVIIVIVVVIIPPAPAAAEADGVAIIVVVSVGGHDGGGRSSVPMLMLVPERACLLMGRWC